MQAAVEEPVSLFHLCITLDTGPGRPLSLELGVTQVYEP